jgi:hypothetical protein
MATQSSRGGKRDAAGIGQTVSRPVGEEEADNFAADVAGENRGETVTHDSGGTIPGAAGGGTGVGDLAGGTGIGTDDGGADTGGKG